MNNPDKLYNLGFFSKFHSIDITNTNVFKTLLIFEKMIQKKAKNNYIYYYNNSQKILNITNNQYYKELIRKFNLLSDGFYQYFKFEKSIEDIIELTNDSLNFF